MKASKMRIMRWTIAVGMVCVFVLILKLRTEHNVVLAQSHKPFIIYRLYATPDGQSHAEKMEVPFSDPGGLFKMISVTGGQIVRLSPGGKADWHPGATREYVISISGHGETEVSDGTKVPLEPGVIVFIDDTTGKGHVTRTIGNEDRVVMLLPFADQSAK